MVRREHYSVELHLFDAGHVALEQKLPELAATVAARFFDRVWQTTPDKAVVALGH